MELKCLVQHRTDSLCGAIPDRFVVNRVCLGLKILNNLVMSSLSREQVFYNINTEDPTAAQRQQPPSSREACPAWFRSPWSAHQLACGPQCLGSSVDLKQQSGSTGKERRTARRCCLSPAGRTESSRKAKTDKSAWEIPWAWGSICSTGDRLEGPAWAT